MNDEGLVMVSKKTPPGKKLACNMCHKGMKQVYEGEEIKKGIGVCTNTRCPNFALLQIPEEDMP